MSVRITVPGAALRALSTLAALTALGPLGVPPPALAGHAGQATADAPADPVALGIGVGLGPNPAESGPLRWEPLGWPRVVYSVIGVARPAVRLDRREHEAAFTGHGEPGEETFPLPAGEPR